ncbi:MAG TPA: dethiobiotin synthase [Burkholderiales bacterium]|nr:dethiobiotin synthase [Burkholderiales bacterium]
MTARGFFVTGTDTGVGKTLVACALLRAFAARGLRVIGMKPVAAGAHLVNGVWVNDDVEQLIAASNVRAPRDAINPYCFESPMAPHIAAAIQKNIIKIKYLRSYYQSLSAFAEVVVIEGAGGFCVPLNDHETSADLAQQLAVPVVLVVGMRLGCLNHALLTAEAIRARGLTLAGWVANHVDPAMAQADANVAALQARLAAPLLARIAFCGSPDAAAVAPQIDLNYLRALP